MFKKGFTLAEVLITLAILGVIAALTLPALQANYLRQAMEKQTLKFYSQMYNALAILKAENESDNIASNGGITDKFIREHFNIVEKYDRNGNGFSNCLPTQYSAIDNKSATKTAADAFMDVDTVYVLADGTVFGITGNDPAKITFDVNGKRGPNQFGYDLWTVFAYHDGSIDDLDLTPKVRLDSSSDTINNTVQTNFTACKNGTSNYGAGCFGHFMRNKFKFDY